MVNSYRLVLGSLAGLGAAIVLYCASKEMPIEKSATLGVLSTGLIAVTGFNLLKDIKNPQNNQRRDLETRADNQNQDNQNNPQNRTNIYVDNRGQDRRTVNIIYPPRR